MKGRANIMSEGSKGRKGETEKTGRQMKYEVKGRKY